MKLFLSLMFISSLSWAIDFMPTTDYETVAASQSQQTLGPVGGQGDILQRVVVIPETSTVGQIYLNDGAGASIIIHTGSVGLVDIKPFVIEVGMRSASGAWKVTTGANVKVIGVGRFK